MAESAREAGHEHETVAPVIEDGDLVRIPPSAWVSRPTSENGPRNRSVAASAT